MKRKTCPFDHRFDFGFRPESYVPSFPTADTFLAKIKGTARRDIARRALEGEELVRLGNAALYSEAMAFALQEELSESERQVWGSAHPVMMGGEYLPTLEENEVEIARVNLRSVTADAISVRARVEDGRISYRVVDDYWDEGHEYEVYPTESCSPLSFSELVCLIDTACPAGGVDELGLVEGTLAGIQEAGQGDPEALLGFATVTSAFYPQITRYYELRSILWAQEHAKKDRLEDEDEPEEMLDDPRWLTSHRAFSGLARLVADAAESLSLDEYRFDLGLPTDAQRPTLASIEIEQIDVRDAESLGGQEYLLGFTVKATAKIDCLVPNWGPDHYDARTTIQDGDWDQPIVRAISTRELRLSCATTFDCGTSRIGQPTIMHVQARRWPNG